MAKRKQLPARRTDRPAGEEESLLLRSAESLGRVIGALQRELESAARRLNTAKSRNGRNGGAAKNGAAKNGAAKKAVVKAVKTTRKAVARKK